jgi:hypothetical protein
MNKEQRATRDAEIVRSLETNLKHRDIAGKYMLSRGHVFLIARKYSVIREKSFTPEHRSTLSESIKRSKSRSTR